jgi:hypothetical protein
VRVALPVFAAILAAACGGTVATASSSGDAGTDGTRPSGEAGAVDGGVVDEGPAVDAAPFACNECLAVDVAWGSNGGLSAYTESSLLNACRQYTHQRSDVALECSVDVGGCGAPPMSIADVEGALAAPDVVAALAGTNQLYGSDPRGCDGAVFQVRVAATTIEIGGDCSQANACGPASGPCVPATAGLRALADVLEKLDAQELATSACTGVFP